MVTPWPVVPAPPQLATSPVPPAVVEAPHVPASAAAPTPAKLIVPVVPERAHADYSRSRTLAKRSVVAKPAPAVIVASGPPPQPVPVPPSAAVQPPPQIAVTKALEPPPLKPVPEQLPAEFIEAQEASSTTADADAVHKPGPTGVKKGLSKFWHLLRGKKPASQDTASSPAPDNP